MKIIEFIIPTYDRYDKINVILNSLICQSAHNWRAVIGIDKEKDDKMESIINSYNNPKFSYFFSGKTMNNWGFNIRQSAKNISNSDYLVMTCDDNYYTPTLVEEINKQIENNSDFIYWNMIHSFFDYSFFNCQPSLYNIDMGAFAIKTSLAKQITFNQTVAHSDGLFVEDFKKSFPDAKMTKINKVLFIHN